MGRMLEALKTPCAKMMCGERGAAPGSQECVVDWSLRDAEEVPYIEVGAGKKIEGSPQVMAVKHPAQTPLHLPVQPPHATAGLAPAGLAPAEDAAGEKVIAGTIAPGGHPAAATAAPAVNALPATSLAATSLPAKSLPANGLRAASLPAASLPAAKAPPKTASGPSKPCTSEPAPRQNVEPVVAFSRPKPLSIAFERWPSILPTGRGICSEAIAFHDPAHPISKQYAELLEQMLAEGREPQALLLCGARPEVGVTTVLLNLGVVAAQGKRRTALIDGHLARPALAERLGHAPRAGLQEAFEGNAALEALLLKTAVAGLHLVAARSVENATVGTLTPEGLAWALAWLKERHDLLLIDGPALEATADLATLAPLCDGIFLVAPQGSHQPSKALTQSLSRHGGRLKGLIHTQFEV